MHPTTGRIAVAINPTASFGRTRDVGPAVVRALVAAGHDVATLRERNGELLRISVARAVADGINALVVVGETAW